jgi:PEP-CTERM motif
VKMPISWSSLRVVLCLMCAVLGTSTVALADPCPTTTLNNYLGSGFSCGIDDKTFSNFIYSGTSNPPGFGLPAGSVAVSPITGPGNPGLQFSAGWFASTSSGILQEDSGIQYGVSVNPGGSPITDVSLSIGGVAWTGTGDVTVDETVCLGAMLPACSGGQVKTLSVFDSSSGSKLFESITFPGVSEVDVQKDIAIEAGTNGNATLSFVTNQFSEGTVPEPSSIMLLGCGILGLGGVLRRRMLNR